MSIALQAPAPSVGCAPRSLVSARKAGSSSWKEQVVTAGANGGRFTASFSISGPAEFVARWAGDSGRQGAGSSVLTVTVKK